MFHSCHEALRVLFAIPFRHSYSRNPENRAAPTSVCKTPLSSREAAQVQHWRSLLLFPKPQRYFVQAVAPSLPKEEKEKVQPLRPSTVVSKLKCPVLLASEMSGF
jgi:hypothetical protein